MVHSDVIVMVGGGGLKGYSRIVMVGGGGLKGHSRIGMGVGGGGYSGYILVGVCLGTPKKGGLRCGHNPKKLEFRTDFVKREGVRN